MSGSTRATRKKRQSTSLYFYCAYSRRRFNEQTGRPANQPKMHAHSLILFIFFLITFQVCFSFYFAHSSLDLFSALFCALVTYRQKDVLQVNCKQPTKITFFDTKLYYTHLLEENIFSILFDDGQVGKRKFTLIYVRM